MELTRVLTVLESEHYAGREQVAAELLASNIAADKIVATLAKMPKAAAPNGMLARLQQTPNPNLGRGAESNTEPHAAADSIWDRVRAHHERND